MPPRVPAALAAWCPSPLGRARSAALVAALVVLATLAMASATPALAAPPPVGAPPMPSVTAPAPSAVPAPAPRAQALRRGSRGAAVRALQRELRQRGLRVTVDGAFGPATAAAVRRVQRRLDRRPTGVADPGLLERLGLAAPAPRPLARPALRAPTAIPAPDAARGARLVELAQEQIGAPYRFAGASPGGFDCSGLMLWLYEQVGVDMPRTTWEQYAAFPMVARADLAAGDVVFFNGLGHNGLYIGNGRFIHAANSNSTVRLNRLTDHWYRDRYEGAIRPG